MSDNTESALDQIDFRSLADGIYINTPRGCIHFTPRLEACPALTLDGVAARKDLDTVLTLGSAIIPKGTLAEMKRRAKKIAYHSANTALVEIRKAVKELEAELKRERDA